MVGQYSGSKLRPLATSPNWTSKSTRTVARGATRARPTARLVATVVLPTPPLGETTLITRPAGGRRGRLLDRAPQSARAASALRLRAASAASSRTRLQFGRILVWVDDVVSAGSKSSQGQLGALTADQDHAERGTVLVQPASELHAGAVRLGAVHDDDVEDGVLRKLFEYDRGFRRYRLRGQRKQGISHHEGELVVEFGR